MTAIETFRQFITSLVPAEWPRIAIDSTMVAIIIVGAVATYYVAKLLLEITERLVSRSATTWDDDMLNTPMLRALAQLAPAISVKIMLPAVFTGSPTLSHWLEALTSLYIIWAIVRIVAIGLTNLYNGLASRPTTKAYAIKGIFQMLKLIAIGLGVIIGLSILLGRHPGVILTTIGASAAVLMLVFKDTILGLVASIQLSANKMVHRGDWIVAERYNANGEVVDVSLTTVKVRNWDNSISTIPPYSLVSDSFRNYEAMRLSGGRRVERSILIDFNSIGLVTPEICERLSAAGIDPESLGAADGKPVANITLLRRWLERFLADDPRVNHDMLSMVRQLQPTERGLPVQLYFFTVTTEWHTYETETCDIFDHVYAIINAFGLAIYQAPTGTDISRLR